ncbi:uncharacterized protein SCHCODRAFT_02033538 [Schizophyllum commune H4-8]|uniref:F-box domain-containing protein n=1 Tax=Schizophyllum commune (strain H4-8 / FGSC 9210) TaxID=578458 RepID=D8PVL0_SCHCM|nr:uncharacterized protein SCHCODRAFT_02033538 [Schizophyllum commune H4-8]KAI5900306.1 hypothetical protein SCHCODRAFT_02033538 [Schizophyllum commune H4-8]
MLADQLQAHRHVTTLCTKCGHAITSATFSVPIEAIRNPDFPTMENAGVIQQNILLEEAAVATYAQTIRVTRKILKDLLREKKTLITHLTRKRALIAPIRRLPTEIMLIILKMSVADTYDRKAGAFRILNHPVLQVCRFWRNLVLDTPQLWTHIRIYPKYDYFYQEEMLKAYLQRSRTLPIDLYLLSNEDTMHLRVDDDDFYIWDPLSEGAELLLSCAHRWRTFQIEVPTESLRETSEPVNLPLLEALFLHSDTRRFSLFKHCPALSSVYLCGAVDPLRHNLPWAQITDLEIAEPFDIFMDNLLKLLSTCQFLRRLALFVPKWELHASQGNIAILPALEYLEVHGSAGGLLKWLIVPNLREIKTVHVPGRHVHPHTTMSPNAGYNALLDLTTLNDATIGDNLTTLSLVTTICANREWTKLFTHYAGVSRLCIVDFSDRTESAGLSLLEILVAHPELLSHLTRLDFPTMCIASPDDQQVLEDFIKQRASTGSGGKLKEINMGAVERKDLVDRILRLREQGICVYTQEPPDLRRPGAIEEDIDLYD